MEGKEGSIVSSKIAREVGLKVIKINIDYLDNISNFNIKLVPILTFHPIAFSLANEESYLEYRARSNPRKPQKLKTHNLVSAVSAFSANYTSS